MSRPIGIFNFHTNTAVPSEGNILTNNYGSEIGINIKASEDTTTFTVKFYGKVTNESDWEEVMFVDLKTMDMNTTVTETSTFNSNWNTGISSFSYLKIEVVNIATGNLTIVGRIVD